MFNKSNFRGIAAVLALFGATAVQALVTPNPASLLSTKKILIIYGTDATTSEHGGARVALNNKFNQLRSLVGFTRDSVNGAAAMPGAVTNNLDQYDIIIFNYWFQSDVSQQTAFQPFAAAFKAWTQSTNKKRGWLGMHTSGANDINEWNWFRDSVTAMQYRVHSSNGQPGTIHKTTDAVTLSQPIMQGLPDSVQIPKDEWYDFAYAPLFADAHVLYYLDEATLNPQLPVEARMNPHPSSWYREGSNGNRYFYTALVHNSSGVNLTAGNDYFPSMMLRALEYLAGYQTTSIKLNGNGMYHNTEAVKGVQFIRDGALKIESEGPYQLQLRSIQGRLLFTASGRGRGSYNPDALRRPGMYVVQVASKTQRYTQRVMVQ